MLGRILISALSVLVVGLGTMGVAGSTVLSLDCSQIESGSVSVLLDNTTAGPVAGGEMIITFDKTAYTVTGVSRTSRTTAIDLFNYSQHASGIKLIFTSFTGVDHSIAAGTGSIATISVTGTGTPEWCFASGTILADPMAQSIAHTVECCEAPQGTVLSLDCSQLASGTVTVNLDSRTAGPIAGGEMIITFDKTAYTVTGVARTSRTTAIDLFNYSQHASGIKLIFTSFTGADHSIAPGTGAIATITVTGTGSDNWCFASGTLLADPMAQPITHTVECCGGGVGVEPERAVAVPAQYALSQNYPNPFNPTTTLNLSLPAASRVNAVIYNVMGQQVRTLADGELPAGYHALTWDGRNDLGQSVSSGVYFCAVRAAEWNTSVKMLLMK